MMATSTYVKGLEGVIAAQTALSLVDGTESQLYYRGIPIHELVKGSHVEETIYLLWHGKLPIAVDLKKLKELDAATLQQLHVDGTLSAIYAHCFSLDNWLHLLERRKLRQSAG